MAMAATRCCGCSCSPLSTIPAPSSLRSCSTVLSSSSSSPEGGRRECWTAHSHAVPANWRSASSSNRIASSRIPSVAHRTFDPGDAAPVSRGKRPCFCCECDCSRASSHLNFQLPSRSFAGFERAILGSGGASCETSDMECKSAAYNPQFSAAERARQRQQQQRPKQQDDGLQPNIGFYLHDLMDQAGIDTTHSRAARAGFTGEVAKLQNKESAESTMDVARAALEISAEDDALVSHSSVPLPVDSYLERLDGMAAEFARHHLPSSSLDIFKALEKFLWQYKGFSSTEAGTSWDARDFYLNGVLTRRRGPPLMLGLLFSEVVKRLWKLGAVDFLVDMFIPVDDCALPHPIYKKPFAPADPGNDDQRDEKGQSGAVAGGSDPDAIGSSPNLLTSENVLFQVLRSLKRLYWPWRPTASSGQGSDFLEAAKAASRGVVASSSTSRGPYESLFNAPASERGSEVAGARAAQYRLQRGIWTSTTFGDLRRALAASERLVMLGGSEQEQRDYGMLLFHAGLYEQAFQYLKSYSSTKMEEPMSFTFNAKDAKVKAEEVVALNGILERLQLIVTERSWNVSSDPPPPLVSPPDPW